MHHLKELIEIFRLTISSKKCHIFGRLAALRGVKTHVPVRFKRKGAYHRDQNILKATISHITSDYGKSNDVEMLRAAGLGCAMANAKPAVKEAADLTLEWSDRDEGVARMCEQLHESGRLRARPAEG